MSNFEHGAIVAELNAGIDAACNSMKAATAAGDSAAVAAASADISRLANDLQVAEEMEVAGRDDDAARAKNDLQAAIETTLGAAIDALNRALFRVGIQFFVGAEEEGLLSAAREVAAARQQYEQAQAGVVETAAALAHLDGVIGETEAKHQAAVRAFADGDRSDEARKRIAALGECLSNLYAARVDARELAAGVESGEALRELCIATALLERRQAQVLARVAKQHIAQAEAATTAAYAAAEKLGEVTDRHLGAGAWAKLLAA